MLVVVMVVCVVVAAVVVVPSSSSIDVMMGMTDGLGVGVRVFGLER